MASAASAITNSGFVSPSRSGTSAIRFLKERFFGLTGPQGNHGEDVKEIYFYNDNTPTHSLHADGLSLSAGGFSLRGIGQAQRGVRRRRPRVRTLGHGCVRGNRFFDIKIEYAKVGAATTF